MFRARLVARLVIEVRVPEGTRARGLVSWSHRRWPLGEWSLERCGGGEREVEAHPPSGLAHGE